MDEHHRALFNTIAEGIAIVELCWDESGRPVDYTIMEVNALPEDVERAARAGFDRHLAKPATGAQLEAVLAHGGR